MKRIASAWLPAWPIERLARATSACDDRAGLHKQLSDAPFVLVAQEHGGVRVTAVNRHAYAGGIRPGLALADARAVLPAIATRPAEPARDRAALVALARWAGRYGPLRHVDGADGLWIDTTGVGHLFGGEDRLAGDLYRRLAGLSITARIAIAPTPGAAHALARFATSPTRPVISVSDDALAEALAPLPVAALRIDGGTALLARRLGLKRIGQLYGLPRESLARRFRSEAAAEALLARLDAALGRWSEPRAGLVELPQLSVARSFPEPLVSSQGLANAVADLTHEIAQVLDRQQLGLRRGRLRLCRADGSAAEIVMGTASPVADAAHLMALIAAKLEAIDAGFGVDLVQLEATAVERLAPRQTVLTADARGFPGADIGSGKDLCNDAATRRNAIMRLVDRLASRLGSGNVVTIAPAPDHIPEHAEVRRPVLDRALSGRSGQAKPADAFAATHRTAPRPALLLFRPEPIAVIAEVPDGPPLRFTWRRVEHRVVTADGPERIEPAWWRALGERRANANRPGTGRTGLGDEEDPAVAALGEKAVPAAAHRPRDYYRVEDQQGACYWLFRDGLYGRDDNSGCYEEAGAPLLWFMHGLFA